MFPLDHKKWSSTKRGMPEKKIAIDRSHEFAHFVGVIKKIDIASDFLGASIQNLGFGY